MPTGSSGLVVTQHFGVHGVADDVGEAFAGGFIHADEFDADFAGEESGLDDAGDAAGDEEADIIVGDEERVDRVDLGSLPTHADAHAAGGEILHGTLLGDHFGDLESTTAATIVCRCLFNVGASGEGDHAGIIDMRGRCEKARWLAARNACGDAGAGGMIDTDFRENSEEEILLGRCYQD